MPRCPICHLSYIVYLFHVINTSLVYNCSKIQMINYTNPSSKIWKLILLEEWHVKCIDEQGEFTVACTLRVNAYWYFCQLRISCPIRPINTSLSFMPQLYHASNGASSTSTVLGIIQFLSHHFPKSSSFSNTCWQITHACVHQYSPTCMWLEAFYLCII